LKTEFFIAKRIYGGKKSKQTSKPIIRIAIIAIAISVCAMLISASVSKGFQREIRNKIIGFGAHIDIKTISTANSSESLGIPIHQAFYKDVSELTNVNNIQIYAIKPGIIQANQDSSEYSKAEKNIQGTIFKGIGEDFNWSFFNENLLEGSSFTVGSYEFPNDSLLVSKFIAQKLNLKLHDKISGYFVEGDGPKERKFIISGIYETGLEEFDQKIVLVDIHHLQRLNKWGIQTILTVSEDCLNHNLVIEAKTFGADSNYEYQWSEKINTINNRVYFCPERDTTIRVITKAFSSFNAVEIFPDTSVMHLKVNVKDKNRCICALPLQRENINDSTNRYFNEIGELTTTFIPKGTGKYYCGGFEVNLNDFTQLTKNKRDIALATGPMLNVVSILDKHPEIFGWLDLLDTNVYVIISLLIVVAIINMSSTLLVIIIERAKTIGLLKAMGSNKHFLSKIFISLGGIIILRGMLWGNLLAFTVIFIQNQFKLFTLPQANYFVSVVPMDWTIDWFIFINLGALLICIFALYFPARLINKLSITKAIKID
jgi:lipoprotein-releasing system permease protein